MPYLRFQPFSRHDVNLHLDEGDLRSYAGKRRRPGLLITFANRWAEAKRGRRRISETMMVVDKRNAKHSRRLDIFSLYHHRPPSLSFGVVVLNICYLPVPCKTPFSCEATGQIFGSWRLKKCSRAVHPSLLDEQEVRLSLYPSLFSSPRSLPFSTHTEILAALSPTPCLRTSDLKPTNHATNHKRWLPPVHTSPPDPSFHATGRTWWKKA